MPCYNTPKRMPDIIPEPAPLAMAMVVTQKAGSPTYDIETALVRGTVFKELDKPFFGKGGCR